MPSTRSPHAAYRRWYVAAGPWAGFFRAVPLVGLARGIAMAPTEPAAAADGLAATILAAGTREGWLGRPDVLLVLDLLGAAGVAAVAALRHQGVRPVLLIFLWPEPQALLPA